MRGEDSRKACPHCGRRIQDTGSEAFPGKPGKTLDQEMKDLRFKRLSISYHEYYALLGRDQGDLLN